MLFHPLLGTATSYLNLILKKENIKNSSPFLTFVMVNGTGFALINKNSLNS